MLSENNRVQSDDFVCKWLITDSAVSLHSHMYFVLFHSVNLIFVVPVEWF